MYQSIPQALIAHAEQEPEQPGLWVAGRAVTYEQLATQATRFAGALDKWGLQKGDRVALFLENCPQFAVAYFGVQLVGGVVVLVNTQYREVELRHILNDAGVRLCVCDAARTQELSLLEDRGQLPTLEAMLVVNGAANDLPVAPAHTRARRLAWDGWMETATERYDLPAGSSLALIGYTSGTTGRSKGAMLLHANLAANIAALSAAWRWTSADRLLLTLPLFHIHGLGVGLHGTIWNGACADLRPRFDATEVFDELLSGRPTMFFGVPTLYTRLLAEAERPERRLQQPPPLRLYVSGSAPLATSTWAAFERRFGQRILERYGMTETLMNLTNPYEGERRPGTVGMPFPGQEARVVDVLTRQPHPDGATGEIEVRGPHVFVGYWQQPAATAEVFDPGGWFRTGDLGWRSADGYYTISGRARELIISGGYNIYPREVEERLSQHPAVSEVAVLGLPDPDFGEQVVAFVVPTPPAPGESLPSDLAEELVTWCRQKLAAYKKPRQVIFVEKLPRNALGKVLKHVLKAGQQTS